jgi:hypothetical protein
MNGEHRRPAGKTRPAAKSGSGVRVSGPGKSARAPSPQPRVPFHDPRRTHDPVSRRAVRRAALRALVRAEHIKAAREDIVAAAVHLDGFEVGAATGNHGPWLLVRKIRFDTLAAACARYLREATR